MISTNPIVANAMAQSAANTVYNASEKVEVQFSKSIKGVFHKGQHPSWSVEIHTDGLGSAYSSKSAEDCLRQCDRAIMNLDEKRQGLLKAELWLERNF